MDAVKRDELPSFYFMQSIFNAQAQSSILLCGPRRSQRLCVNPVFVARRARPLAAAVIFLQKATKGTKTGNPFGSSFPSFASAGQMNLTCPAFGPVLQAREF
jgi:hypothetical protein